MTGYWRYIVGVLVLTIAFVLASQSFTSPSTKAPVDARRLPGVYFCDAPRQVLALLPDGRGIRITDAAEKPARLEWEVFLFTEPGEPETLSLFKHETRDLIEFATFTILDSKSSPGAYDIEYSVDKGGSSMLRRCAASALPPAELAALTGALTDMVGEPSTKALLAGALSATGS